MVYILPIRPGQQVVILRATTTVTNPDDGTEPATAETKVKPGEKAEIKNPAEEGQ